MAPTACRLWPMGYGTYGAYSLWLISMAPVSYRLRRLCPMAYGPPALRPCGLCVAYGTHGLCVAPMAYGTHGLWHPWPMAPMTYGTHGLWHPWPMAVHGQHLPGWKVARMGLWRDGPQAGGPMALRPTVACIVRGLWNGAGAWIGLWNGAGASIESLVALDHIFFVSRVEKLDGGLHALKRRVQQELPLPAIAPINLNPSRRCWHTSQQCWHACIRLYGMEGPLYRCRIGFLLSPQSAAKPRAPSHGRVALPRLCRGLYPMSAPVPVVKWHPPKKKRKRRQPHRLSSGFLVRQARLHCRKPLCC